MSGPKPAGGERVSRTPPPEKPRIDESSKGAQTQKNNEKTGQKEVTGTIKNKDVDAYQNGTSRFDSGQQYKQLNLTGESPKTIGQPVTAQRAETPEHAAPQDGQPAPVSQTPAVNQATTPKLTLDPNNYNDRLTMMRMMYDAHPLPKGWPNPMDGMPIQTEWQLKSGRSEHAWWREANSTLTVDQFRALQSRGEFANIELQTPDGKYNPPPLSEDLRQKNLAYWDHVDRISNEGTPPTQANVDSLQRTLWNWHEPAIHAGLRRADKDLNSLPPAERRFAQAWGESMVDYLAKGNFPTNGENIKTINEKFLPSRIVRPEDYGTKPTDLGPLQQRTVQALDAFHTIDKLGLNHLIGSNAAGVAGSIPWSRGKLLEMLDAAVKNPDQAEAIMEDIGQKVDRVRDLVPQFPDLEWPDWLRIPGVTPPSTTLSR